MRKTLGQNLGEYDPLAFVAMIVGPALMAAGLIFTGYEFHRAAFDLRNHVHRIAARDVVWGPLIVDVHEQTKEIASTVDVKIGMIAEQNKHLAKTLDQIINDQKELIAIVQGKRIGELMSSKKKHERFAGDVLSEFSDHDRLR